MKILLISHNPLTDYQNMGKTLKSLFYAFDKKDICQIYVYPSFPEVDMVNSCYRITDRDAMRAILPCGCVGQETCVHKYNGEIIENKADAVFYAKKSNNLPLKRLIRDTVWKLSHWYSKQLQEWLDREAPTCIFLAAGYAKFIYDIALKISQDRNIPIVTYMCDDYYFLNVPKSLIGRYQLGRLKKKISSTMERTKLLITISKEMGEQYSKEFSVDTKVVMTGADIKAVDSVVVKDEIRSLSYFGNVDVNRERPLSDIGRLLDEINEKNSTDYCLKIYTNTKYKSVTSAFSKIKSIRMCKFVVGADFVRELTGSDCLVHVEDFSEESVDLVKGSVSTKIANSLASSIPLLAYGPSNIASIEHLKRNDCAFVANSYEALSGVLNEVFEDREKRYKISANALNVAKKYHSSFENSKKLREIMEHL